MAIKRIFNKCLIISLIFFNNVLGDVRDPFKPTQKIKSNDLLLNAILIVENKQFASISYNEKNYVVTAGDIIEQSYKIKKINDNELAIINLDTNQEKVILLPS